MQRRREQKCSLLLLTIRKGSKTMENNLEELLEVEVNKNNHCVTVERINQSIVATVRDGGRILRTVVFS